MRAHARTREREREGGEGLRDCSCRVSQVLLCDGDKGRMKIAAAVLLTVTITLKSRSRMGKRDYTTSFKSHGSKEAFFQMDMLFCDRLRSQKHRWRFNVSLIFTFGRTL